MRRNSTMIFKSPGPRRGGALIASLIAVIVVFGFCMAFLQLSLRVTRSQGHAADARQAFYLAESGLAEGYAAVAVSKSGNIGSQAQPAAIGDGLFWVETTDLGDNFREIESTAMHGAGRATLSIVVERVPLVLSSLGFFTPDDIQVNPDYLIDSYDSSQGSYFEQKAAGENLDQAILGSNGDISFNPGTVLMGDLLHGPDGSFTSNGGTVTGTVSTQPAPISLPPVEVPALTLGPPVIVDTTNTPYVIPAGDHGIESLTVKSGARVIVTGPATLVLDDVKTFMNSELVFDTRDGHIDIYANESFDLGSGSVATTVSDDPNKVTVQIAAVGNNVAHLGAKSMFRGSIYAPEAGVHVEASFEIFGGIVSKSLTLSASGKMHMDLNLAANREDSLPLMWTWRVVDIPGPLAAKGNDPFQALGINKSTLPLPKDAHQDQHLELKYYDLSGAVQAYDGQESAFDWWLVKEVIEGYRDGVAFQSVPEKVSSQDAATAALTPEEQALIDQINSPVDSATLSADLQSETPLTDPVMLAAIHRVPSMDSRDLYWVLLANGPQVNPMYVGGIPGGAPLADPVLLAAITNPTLVSKDLGWILDQNSPLPPAVLDAAINRDPPMNTADLNKVLGAQ